MTKKASLSVLQARFGLNPVEVQPENFTDMPSLIAGFLKDGGTPAELEKEFGEFTGKVYANLAKEGTFYLKPLLSAAQDAYEASVINVDGDHKDMAIFRAKLVSRCWCYKNGSSVGTPKQVGNQMRTDLVVELFTLAQEMNGMTPKSIDEAGKD